MYNTLQGKVNGLCFILTTLDQNGPLNYLYTLFLSQLLVFLCMTLASLWS